MAKTGDIVMTADRIERQSSRPRVGRVKIVLGLILLLLSGAAVALYFVPTDFYVAGFGNALSARDAVLRAGSKGPIHAIFVESGQRVTKGQVILELESEVEQSEVTRCQRELEQAQAELNYLEQLLEAERLKDEIEVKFAAIKRRDTQAELERVKKLRQNQAASDREYNAAIVADQLADAELQRCSIDRSGIRKAQLEVQEKKIATLQAQLDRAKGTLARRKIYAPLDGIIVLHALSIGRVVDANEVLGQIFDDKYYQVVARVPEKYAPLLRKDQSVSIELSASSHWQTGYLKGQLYWVSPVVNPHGSGDGTVLIKARLTDVPQHIQLKAGMSAEIWVKVGTTRALWKLIGLSASHHVPHDDQSNE